MEAELADKADRSGGCLSAFRRLQVVTRDLQVEAGRHWGGRVVLGALVGVAGGRG